MYTYYMYDLNGFIIIKSEKGLRWKMRMTGDVVMSGDCTLMPDVLVLHSYDDICEEKMDDPQNVWEQTKYYMTVSESGVTHIYNSADGEEADENVKRDIGKSIGCTMRFRQG